MSWPLISDFSRMLQRPQVAFRNPGLRGCTVELDALGQPKARSGNFATVYRGVQPDGSEVAIRVFNRRADKRRERYQTISEYLCGRRLSCLVGFEYDEQGMRSASDGKLYPLVTMDWVPGVTLFEWARDRCAEGYQTALLIGAQAWLELVRELEANRIVHGDLQHGNVLVSREGHFKLVDYDGMCVPELFEHENLETGLPPYQHPGRTMDTRMFMGLDNFSALFIYVTLRALAAAPHLWFKYVEVTGYDKLLFRAEDFADPSASPLLKELLQSPDQQVRDLSHYLFQLTEYDLRDVPTVDEVLLWCNRLEDLLAAQDWDTAVKLLDRMSEHETIDPSLQPLVTEAHRKVAFRRELENALKTGDESRAQQIYESGVLKGYPAAEHLVQLAGQAEKVQSLITVLTSSISLQGWEAFRATWEENKELLSHRASTKHLKLEMQKLLTIENLQLQLSRDDSADEMVLQSWEYLESLGGHKLADPLRPAIEARRQRQLLLSRLTQAIESAPHTPTRDSDLKIVAAWKPEVMEGWQAIAAQREAFEAAKRRLKCLKQTVASAKTKDLAGERRIAEAVGVLPPEYIRKLNERMQLAKRRVQTLDLLQNAIHQPIAEAAVLNAWNRLTDLKGAELAEETVKQRVELARQRSELLTKLRNIPAGLEPQEKGNRVAEIWDEQLLSDCADAATWKATYDRFSRFRHRIAQVQEAIRERDLATLREITASASEDDGPDEWRRAVEDAKAAIDKIHLEHRQGLLNSLTGYQRSQFLNLFDIGVVRSICEHSPHHRQVVSGWVEQDILPLDRVGLCLEPTDGLTKLEDGNWRASWKGPASRFATACRLQVCSDLPKPYTIPEDTHSVYSCTMELQGGENREHCLQVNPDWNEHWVVVWAELDLGFQVFFSPPLGVGRLDLTEKSRRWGLFGR